MKLCVSGSVLPFRAKAERIWKLDRYQWPRDIFESVVFFGMYHIGDYFHFIRHLGKKIVFWCGSDILALKKKKWPAKLLKGAEHYCENEVEKDGLLEMSIRAKIRQSFLEDVNDFPISYKSNDKSNVYLCSNAEREIEYGVNFIEEIAYLVPDITFHIYGVKKEIWFYNNDPGRMYNTETPINVIYHGRVPPKKFNEEIKDYQCGLRLNEHDGFSEIIAKSALMGQYPISRIPYPFIDSYKTKEQLIRLLKDLPNKQRPNYEASHYWRKNLNDLPFLNKEK